MKEETYRKDYGNSRKAIFPHDKWACSVCLLPSRELYLFYCLDNWRYLICALCKLDLHVEENAIVEKPVKPKPRNLFEVF